MRKRLHSIAALRWLSSLVLALVLLMPVAPAPGHAQAGAELTTLKIALPATAGASVRPAAELRPVIGPSVWGLPRSNALVALVEARIAPPAEATASSDRRRDLRRTRPRRHVPRMDPSERSALA